MTGADAPDTDVADAIPTRTLRLERWLRVRDVEGCFPTQRGGALILKDSGRTLLDETLAPVRLQGRPVAGSFPTTHAQRLPDGGWALASARSKVGEHNLQLFDDRGRFRTSFPVGDGIEHLAVDRRGRVWVGYFDEGIGGDDPLSIRGLSRFDQHGNLEYQWDHAGNGPIDDCYALTLDEGGGAWICPYTRFFVAVVADDTPRIVLPEAPVSLPSGMLVGAAHVGLIGGIDFHGQGDAPGAILYGNGQVEVPPRTGPEPTNKDSVVTIVDLRTRARTQVQLLDAAATPLTFSNRVYCRAGIATCWTDDRVFRFSLDDLLNA